MRIGIGFDVHKLVEKRNLIIGGVNIPFEKGLLGHSDADVLAHAIMDAMLGALALGSIGDHFPDDDDKYKNANSLELLKQVYILIKQKQYDIVNIDSIIVAEKPKFKPYINEMRKNISQTLDINIDLIAIKATSTEQLGFEGRKEGISAKSVVLLKKC